MTFNLDVMAILDAGLHSAASGKLETVDNAACASAEELDDRGFADEIAPGPCWPLVDPIHA
jgi:hypothetical protein